MPTQKAATKSEQAYQTLRDDILKVRLKPLAPLRLDTIRAAYNVGWTPLREALTRLEAEHLVVSTANKGFVVAPVSMDELRDLTKSKRVIEMQLLEEAIERGDEDWEASIVAAHHRFSRCSSPLSGTTSPEELNDWGERHDAFHAALLAANDSPWLARYYRQLTDHMRRHGRALRNALSPELFTFARDNMTAEYEVLRKAYSLEAHTALMDAALNRQASEALRLLREHNELTRQAYDALETAGLSVSKDLNKDETAG